jgi:membrane-associated phospholipid phosphatase
MISYLIELDKVLFILINQLLANPVTDVLMPFITSDTVLRIVYILILVSMLIFGDRRIRWLVLFSGLTMLLTDQVAAGFLKPLIARPRPCQVFTDIHLLVSCGAGFSMPSAHAANTFGQAALLSRHIKHSGWFLYLFAIMVALSRVFVGVHYPGDILVGAIIGMVIGAIVSGLFRVFSARILKRRKAPPEPENEEPVEQSQE